MATYDMTSSDTAGVGANVLAVPTVVGNSVRTIEAILDIDAMVTAGYSGANGDVFQLLEIPAESVIVAGHDSAVATAEQINKTETYRDPDSFADIVRGMHLYGRKILRPEGIVTAKYNAA